VLAVRAIRYGGDDPVANLDIGEVPDPSPGPGEVRLPFHNANLFPTLEGPVLCLSPANARSGNGRSKSRVEP
jgi:hypothetical protein